MKRSAFVTALCLAWLSPLGSQEFTVDWVAPGSVDSMGQLTVIEFRSRLTSANVEEIFPGARVMCLGQPVCRTCGQRMPKHYEQQCFSCQLGIDEPSGKGLPKSRMKHALALLQEQGPAGGRGLRVDAIRARASRPRRNATTESQKELI